MSRPFSISMALSLILIRRVKYQVTTKAAKTSKPATTKIFMSIMIKGFWLRSLDILNHEKGNNACFGSFFIGNFSIFGKR